MEQYLALCNINRFLWNKCKLGPQLVNSVDVIMKATIS